MEERGHILEVLQKVKSSLKKEDYVEIKILSDNIIHNASINQDPDIISIAVIIYSLSKLIERKSYQQYKNWNGFYKKYTSGIDNSITALQKEDIEGFREEISSIRNLIEDISGNLKKHIQEVFRKAEINKASRIYEHGISMEKTAKILGISIWELAEYAGSTGIGDVNLGITLPIRERIKQAQEMFRK